MRKMWWFIFTVTLVAKSTCLGTVIIVRDADCDDPCFRRLLSGKRISDLHVKRVMECDRVQDCHRMCEYERAFPCEGFNFRPRSTAKSMCELASMPPSRVDINRDFISDPRYDYYERDWTRRKCEPRRDKGRPPVPAYHPSPGWWPDAPHRPAWQPPGGKIPYIPPAPTPLPPVTPGPSPYGGSFIGQTRITFEVPRPIDRNRRPDWYRPGANDVARPGHPPPLPVRPIEGYYPGQTPVERPRPDDIYYHNRVPPPIYGPPHFLPSRPSDDGYAGNGYSYGRPGDGSWPGHGYGHKYPIRRIGHTPDPATNEISTHYLPTRRKPPKTDSDGYDPAYAGGYHSHYAGDSKLHPRPTHPEPPPYPKAPPEHDHYYGQFYNYGGAYGYAERPALPPKILPQAPRECSIRSAGGFRLARGIIRKSYLTANLEQCENLCQNQKEFTCLTFAYRYNLAATSPSDNCLLSDAPFENLVFYTDLEPDRDYDIYAMTTNAKWCESRGRPPSSARRPRPPDECFWRVRSGFGMPPSVVKKPVRVDGMGECQVECVSSKDFTCRSFVFRYEPHPVTGLPNCYLSDWPAVEIEPQKMQDMDGAELYERGSFGRGCEPHHPIPLPDPTSPSRPAFDYKPSRTDEASCYAGYDRPCKLTPYAIVLTTKVDSEAECRKKCSVMRQNNGRNSPPCMSFSYKVAGDEEGDNCHLSDVPTRDLRPGLDYTHDEDYTLYVWKELEPRCFFVDEIYDHPIDLPPSSLGGKPYAKPEDPYYYEVTAPEPNKPGPTALGPYIVVDDKPSPIEDERFLFPAELTLFSHYTVSGYPCKRGTKCEKNPVAGFWSCVPEDAEPGSWDYCCEPSHFCGFSQGHSYPWCYVGFSMDQWRPCSETYYPYSMRPRPVRPIPDSPPYIKCEYDSECRGRHWPVAVLHGESPPNGTDSVALANNHDDNKSKDAAVTPMVTPIEEANNATNSSGNLTRRRKEEITLLPLRIISSRFNRSEGRVNSRYRINNSAGNSSAPGPPRFSRNDSPQYFITRRLNAMFSTQPANRTKSSKGTIGKIERIVKPGRREVNLGQRLVMVASSKGPRPTPSSNVKIAVPPVSVTVSNVTTVIPNSTRPWVKMDTIDRSEE